MLFSSILAVAAAATSAAATSVLGPRSQTGCKANLFTPKHHAQVVERYLDLWGGNFALLNQTISPALLLQVDRFPNSADDCSSHAGSTLIQVNSSAAFGEFVSRARVGYSKYDFDADFWFAQDNKIVIRWSLDAVIGNVSGNATRLPTTLKPGDPFTYNGTDILVLNRCTGRADAIYSAQDLINGFHNLGLTSITV